MEKRKRIFILLLSFLLLSGCERGGLSSTSNLSSMPSSSSEAPASSSSSISSEGSSSSRPADSSSSSEEEEQVVQKGKFGETGFALLNMENLPLSSASCSFAYDKTVVAGSSRSLKLAYTNNAWPSLALHLPSGFLNAGGILSLDIAYVDTPTSGTAMLSISDYDKSHEYSFDSISAVGSSSFYHAVLDFSLRSGFLTSPTYLALNFNLQKSTSVVYLDNISYQIPKSQLSVNGALALASVGGLSALSVPASEEVCFCFDLLHWEGQGSLGFLLSSLESLQTGVSASDSLFFAPDGTLQVSSSISAPSSYLIQSGYRYRVSAEREKKKFTLEKRGYYESDASFQNVFTATLSGFAFSLAGIGLLSTSGSSTLVIDNLEVISSSSFQSDFNSPLLPAGLNTFTATTKCAVFSWGYRGNGAPSYDVSFVDEEGTLLSHQLIARYGYASLPTAPSKDGYRFSGWLGGDYQNVVEELLLYPSYVLGEASL